MWHKKKTAVAAVVVKPVCKVRISAAGQCPFLFQLLLPEVLDYDCRIKGLKLLTWSKK